MIICGFAGIGKSTLAKNRAGFVDLESTPFEKDWIRYAKVAEHMSTNGYTVMLSCHREIREELHNQSVRYILAIPDKSLKAEYLKRYGERSNTTDFIELLDKNWESFLTVLPHETRILIVAKYLELSLPSFLKDLRKPFTFDKKLYKSAARCKKVVEEEERQK